MSKFKHQPDGFNTFTPDEVNAMVRARTIEIIKWLESPERMRLCFTGLGYASDLREKYGVVQQGKDGMLPLPLTTHEGKRGKR